MALHETVFGSFGPAYLFPLIIVLYVVYVVRGFFEDEILVPH